MRRLLSIVLVLFFIAASSFSISRKQSYKIRTIVIDAGHGGHDSGCLGASAKEKNIALAVSLKLGRLIEENYPDVRVIYTRKTDVFIPLHERADIANKNKADLFICIHCNSGGGKGAFGVETYVMGLHKTEENLAVARRENAAILLEEDYKTQYEGFDPKSAEANIIFNLYQNQFLNQSLEFASNVQNQVVEYAGRHNRGVRQAGFLVLYKTAMPSVLIETGFLTHDTEEKYLLSEKGQNNLASCIYRAFKEYKIDSETAAGTENAVSTTESAKSKNVPVKESSGSVDSENENSSPVTEKEHAAGSNSKNEAAVLHDSNSSHQPVVEKMETKHNTIKKPAETVVAPMENPVKTPDPVHNKNNDIFITIQIGATTEAEKKIMNFDKVEGVMTKKSSDGYIRYLVGRFNSTEAAHKKQEQLRSLGFRDCFLSAYQGDKKIPVAEALEKLKRNK